MRSKATGFTLIELMIVVAIVGILAAVAYPSYTEYVKRSHRSEIASLLTEQTQALERYFSRNGQYSDVAGNPMVISPGNAYYTIAPLRTVQNFTLTAIPIAGTMMSGDKCGNFIITNTGSISNSTGLASKDCWGR